MTHWQTLVCVYIDAFLRAETRALCPYACANTDVFAGQLRRSGARIECEACATVWCSERQSRRCAKRADCGQT